MPLNELPHEKLEASLDIARIYSSQYPKKPFFFQNFNKIGMLHRIIFYMEKKTFLRSWICWISGHPWHFSLHIENG